MKKSLPFIVLLCVLLGGVLFPTAAAQAAAPRKGKPKKTAPTSAAVKGPEAPVENLYAKLRSRAESDGGLFTIYRLDDKYYFEIPDSLLGREMLMVTRRAKTAMDIGFGGELLDERVFVWDKRGDKYIHLRAKSYRKKADRKSGMYDAVASCMVPPILASLPIKGFAPDSTSCVVEVTDLFRKDALAFDLNADAKKRYALQGLEDASCYIKRMKSFPANVEVTSVKTYSLGGKSEVTETDGLKVVTLEIHNSLLLLPEKPMMPRYADERIGYFSQRQWDYSFDDAQRAVQTSYIRRWRLEPSDTAAFRAGKAVEPLKPIVYYLSPSIPSRWVKYFIQGVEDWQPAFEAAGFKNAIQARPIPSKAENPDFDPLDARYSMIEYFASYVENSYGPHVADPRSGEIIESHVCIYHNAMKLLHDWYLIQCGAADPAARKPKFDEALMGRLIRYLVAHEIGHTLGLMHNFAGSNAYPVDSLRSASFTRRHGTTASIMDYARFNYIAQPEDGEVYRFPKIGEYDCYAIEWGYRPILGAETPEEERPVLNAFIKSRAGDPRYLYIRQFLIQNDPRGQTEDLGDDPFKASELGLRNLKIVFDSLDRWTAREGYGNKDLTDLYRKACVQWARYIRHVATCIGGVYETYKTADQPGPVYTLVEKQKQQRAVEFVARHAFEMPEWIAAQPYVSRFDMSLSNTRKIQEQQASFVHKMLNVGVLLRLAEHHAKDPETAYDPRTYLSDVRRAVWKDLYGTGRSDLNRRVLQRVYLSDCEKLLEWRSKDRSASSLDLATMEFKTLVRLDLQRLEKDLGRRLAATTDPVVGQHYKESLHTIETLLDPERRK